MAKGRVAGLNMATEPVHAYEKGAPLNVTRLAGFKITIIGTVGSGKDSDLEGISRGDSETWRSWARRRWWRRRAATPTSGSRSASGTIVGAVVMGDQALSFPLQELIEARADVSGIVPRLRGAGGSGRRARERLLAGLEGAGRA